MGSVTLQVVATNKRDEQRLTTAGRAFVLRAGKRIGQGDRTFLQRFRSRPIDEESIKALDANSDGKLQKSEIPVRVRDRIFKAADLNRDDVLDNAEITQALEFWRKANQ